VIDAAKRSSTSAIHLPAHWLLAPLYSVVTVASGATPSKEDSSFWSGSIPWVSPKDMKVDVLADAEDHVSESALRQTALRLVEPPAVLIVIRGMILAHTVPVALTAAPVTVNQDMKALRPSRHLDARYLAHQLRARSSELLAMVEEAGHGTRCLRTDLWRKLGVALPPLDEQRAIADFLDRKTTAIDALIEKKERGIQLLHEKRQAVVWQAVTKGLSTSVAMRESGREWIGTMPAHWDLARTRHVARLRSGHTPSRLHPEYWVPEECTIPWVSLADVWQLRDGSMEEISETQEKISPIGLANSAARLLPAQTVIVSRTASVGFSAIITQPMATTQDFVNWICGPRLRPRYLLYVFRAMRDEFRRLTMGSTHQTIYMPDVAKFVTPVPPLEEQDAIVNHLRKALARTDTISARINRQVELLRDYRRVLITSAVTGQLDVTSRAA
jgi:type I restriction enzyme S subunit